ncbi:MAG: type III secretion system export apparatus subunit SctR [Desulfovibrionaceae bacterium]|jgi:type III secretion protein R|nr:type III secretion system export apparatus subunit SctR [Desulfovibrionaceae bacterium]
MWWETLFANPLALIGLLVSLSLAPFVAIMVTSYVKLVVVMSLIRNALGVQQIPPNMVLNGLAIILTIFVMAPVGGEMMDIVQRRGMPDSMAQMRELGEEAAGPLRAFLLAHSEKRERAFFLKSAQVLWPKEKAAHLDEQNLIILVPAFAVTELTAAFKIGFLLYLPFVAIDLIVSNILLAMGMMMVSPMTISLPFKLLLFVLLEGWAKTIHGLLLTYR